MKLLFDQNISHRILHRLEDIYPEAAQVKNLGLETKPTVKSGDMQKNIIT